jgi:hypothetical protein
MRLHTLLLVFALLLSISSPYTAHLSIAPTDQTNYFVTLNVCDAHGLYISTNADGSCLHEPFRQILPLALAGFIDISDHHFQPDTLFFPLEHPPKS